MSEVSLTAEEALRIARQQCQAGNLPGAQYICRQILAGDPRDAEALQLLGLMDGESGNLASAIEHLQLALLIEPRLVAARHTLGLIYTAQGEFPEAVACYQQVVAEWPGNVDSKSELDTLLKIQSYGDNLLPVLLATVKLRPRWAEAHSKLARALVDLGRFDEAQPVQWRAVDLDPRNPKYQLDLGKLLELRSSPAEAVVVYSAVIERAPDFAPAYTARASLLADHKLFDEAMIDHRKAIELTPLDPNLHLAMAKTLSATGELESVRSCCNHALELDPGSAGPWESLGKALQTNGRFKEAAAAFQQALAVKPKPSVAILLGQATHRFDRSHAPQWTAQLNTLLNDPALSEDDRIAAGFALGDALDEAGRFDDAFAEYAGANKMFKTQSARQGHVFDPGDLAGRVDAMLQQFTPRFFQDRRSWGDPSQTPVFIVGIPRSGTSLVEQIISSHSQVFGAGERFDIALLRSRLAATKHGDAPMHWTPESVKHEAESYLKKLGVLGNGAQRVVDKMPANTMHLGLIGTFWPNARVIFCQRDPRDVCLSCFFQHFGKHHQMFSYDLTDCAAQFTQHQRMTEHWRSVLQMRTLFVQYEQLVANLEGESRRLTDFLGLAWEPACMEFYKTQRPVLTRSGWQVRQPIYTRSVGRWKHYANHLEPLRSLAENQPPLFVGA